MWCALYLCCLIVVGYPAAAGFARGAARLEIAALSACIGPGIMGIALIFLSMLGLRPSVPEIFSITACGAVAGGIIAWKRKPSARLNLEPQATSPLWLIVCTLAIAYGVFSVAYDALVIPVSEWDAFAIWQLKAEVLAVHPLIPRPQYFYDVSLSYSHLRYPLLVPMASAGMHAMTGRLDDLGKAISLLWYGGMLSAVFALVRRLNGATAALTATALLACSMPMCRYAGSGTAEVALAAFYTGSIVCVVGWQQSQEWGYVVLTALFSALMAWTKNEGLALGLINVLVIAAMGKNRRKALAAAALVVGIVAVIYLPWIFYIQGLPRTDEDYAARLNLHQLIANAGKILPAMIGLGVELVDIRRWGLFWEIALALMVLQWKRLREPAAGVMGAMLLLHLLAYIPPLVVAKNWNLSDLLYTTSDRLILHVAPAGAILVGLLWPKWMRKTERSPSNRG
jgi:hypothetical protein